MDDLNIYKLMLDNEAIVDEIVRDREVEAE